MPVVVSRLTHTRSEPTGSAQAGEIKINLFAAGKRQGEGLAALGEVGHLHFHFNIQFRYRQRVHLRNYPVHPLGGTAQETS